jgi:dipeptidyl aminopeptidase/acylaminoacyl peptidase
MRTITDICYGENRAQCLDIHLPDAEEFSVLVYFHGGGLEGGDKKGPKLFFEYMTACKIAVVSANYRMYPNARYPEFVEDAASVVAWTIENIANYGKVKEIYVGGSSAGGYLSQMLCFDKRWLAKHGIAPTDISGYIHDAGQPTCHFNVLRERGIDSRRVMVDDSAPLYHIGEDNEYSPMLVIVSDNDMKGRYEQTMLLIATLEHFGHADKVKLKVMNGKHCAYVGAADQNGDSVLGKIVAEFILS